MYGLLIESVADFIKRRYGNSVWEKVRKKAKIENHTFSTHQQYSETFFLRAIKSVAEIVGEDPNEILEELGVEFVNFVSQYGYDKILRVLGRHMRDFLNGLDNLHEYLKFSYPKLKPPSFFVEKESQNGLVLHYRSIRKGYLYYVKGQLKQVAKVFYNLDIKIDVLSENNSAEMSHAILQLHFKNDQYDVVNSSTSLNTLIQSRGPLYNLNMNSNIFFELFPFHLVFNKNMTVVSIGRGLEQAMRHAEGESIKDLFNLVRPLLSFTWDNIISHTNNVFELTTIEPIKRSATPTDEKIDLNLLTSQSTDSGNDDCLKLKGQMMYIKDWDAIVFLATPVLENLDIMFSTGFYINDLSMHDSSRDLVLVGTQQSAELKLALDQEKQKSKALEESMKKLDIEMKRTDQLLYQMIPKKIADRLRTGEAIMNLCEVVQSCTILFSDVVGFTQTCSQLSPMEVVSMLNSMYTKFDSKLETHNVYKVETIGDAYMVASGLPERTPNHAEEIVEMGFDMLNEISTLVNPATGQPLRIRVGCHSGPVVAGVVGIKMPRYCLFGDTVNTASRMESSSEAMKIHVSQSTKILLSHKPYKIAERGKLEIKGKGEMKTFFVVCKLDEYGKEIKFPYMKVLEEVKRKESLTQVELPNAPKEVQKVKQEPEKKVQKEEISSEKSSEIKRSSGSEKSMIVPIVTVTVTPETNGKYTPEKTSSTEETIISNAQSFNFLEKFSSNNSQVDDINNKTGKIVPKKQNSKKNTIFKSITCQIL